MTNSPDAEVQPSLIDRVLRLASDVRAGEGATVLLMTLNVFMVMLAYYFIKTAREPLILVSGGSEDAFSGPEAKAYAAAAQALVLIPATRLYARLTERWPIMVLIRRVLVFFSLCLVAFWIAAQARVPYLGFIFFIWVGIFNVAAVAQFWAFANDVYKKEVGERVFPVVMIGMALGGFAGGQIAGALLGIGISPFTMMLVTSALLMAHLGVYQLIAKRPDVDPDAGDDTGPSKDMGTSGAFSLILNNPYLMRIAAMLVLANFVNTTGEYVLTVLVTEHAATTADAEAFIGEFFGSYYGTVSLIVLLVQVFLVSRLVKYGGIRAAVLALPLIALGAYSLIALGAGFAAVRWAKTAENATDYSVMGTAKAMLWLPATREEKYKAKLAIDTVFVRFGDMLASGMVALGIHVFGFALVNYATVNLVVILVWLTIAFSLAKRYENYTAEARAVEAATAVSRDATE